jgi:hypothetical protein
MPLILDSGESKPIVIRIRAGLSKKVTDKIKEKFKLPSTINFKKVKEELEKSGIDLFNNGITTQKVGDTKILTITNPKYPSYILVITTSNNTVFSETISIDKGFK